MRKRRGLSRLAAVALAGCLMLTGCQSENGNSVALDPGNPVSLEVWHYYNGPQKTSFDSLVNEFNETVGLEKGIIVEAFSQGNVTELTEKVIAAAQKKVGTDGIPNIFAAYADTAYQIDQMGLAAELDPYMTEQELSEYVDAYLEEGRFDEKQSLKIFPTAKSTEVMMINRTDWDAFATACGASIDSLSTMEGIAETAKRYYEWTDSLTEEPEDGKAFFGRDAMANYFVIGCKQLGVEIFSANDGKVTFNLDKKIIKRLWDNFYIPYINGYYAAYGKFRSDDAKTGDIILLVCSTSGSAYFPTKVSVNDETSYDIEMDVMAPPSFEGGEKYAVQQGAGMVVTKSDAKAEYASTVFLKWFTDAQRNIDFSAGSGYLPVKKEANNSDSILKALEKEEGSVAQNLRKVAPIAVGVVNDYMLYTNKAFEGGTSARAVLENSMMDKARQDRQEVQEKLEQGFTRSDAVAPFLEDEYFDAWYDAFTKALNEAIQ